jgi:hypothetical protein
MEFLPTTGGLLLDQRRFPASLIYVLIGVAVVALLPPRPHSENRTSHVVARVQRLVKTSGATEQARR